MRCFKSLETYGLLPLMRAQISLNAHVKKWRGALSVAPVRACVCACVHVSVRPSIHPTFS